MKFNSQRYKKIVPLKTMALVYKSTIKEQVNCVKEGFSFKNSEQLKLVIEAGVEGFSYALFDANGTELLALQAYTFSGADSSGIMNCLSDLETRLELFKHSFKNVLINWKDNVFTMVPNALYKTEQKETFLQFNHNISKNSLILTDEIKAAESRCIYAIPANVKLFFDKHFPNHKLKHFISVLIEDSLSLVPGKEKKCVINIGQSQLDIAVVDKGLIFSNTFSYQSTEDLIYFILLSMEQNHCDTLLTEVYISGEIEANSTAHKITKQYIKHVNFLITDSRVSRSEKFNALPHHFYYHLINRIQCA